MAGNVWDWIDAQCDTTSWYNSGGWVDWNHASLTDWEKLIGGPSGDLTSANGAGKYYGCSSSGNAIFRGGEYGSTTSSGVYAAILSSAPSALGPNVGFRCVYSNAH